MAFIVHVPDPVRKDILQVPLPWRNRIVIAIDHLESDPWYGDKMLGKYKDQYKIRIWPYRILYRVDKKKKVVVINEVGQRGGMY